MPLPYSHTKLVWSPPSVMTLTTKPSRAPTLCVWCFAASTASLARRNGEHIRECRPCIGKALGMVGYAAESGRAILRQRNRKSRMPETVTVDGTPVAKGAATVSASALALHLDCSRTYIGKLEAEGVLRRQGDGFPLDQSRIAYLRYLRRERRQSLRAKADADHVKVETEMLQLCLMEKKRELVRMDGQRLIDGICGVVLTHLSSLPARCAPRGDLAIGAASSESYSRCVPRWPTSAKRWPTSMASHRLASVADE
jgi:hypothetical protein